MPRPEMRLGARLLRGAHVLALGVPLFCGGCTKTACFEWSAADGACPAQGEALSFFEEPKCHFSQIKSVDSEGEFDEDVCCYEVTEWSKSEERIPTCQ